MTAYATRSPLQLLMNTHYAMTDQRQSTRRTSARLREKEDAPQVDMMGYSIDKGNGAHATTTSAVQGKATVNGTGKPKRRLGKYPSMNKLFTSILALDDATSYLWKQT